MTDRRAKLTTTAILAVALLATPVLWTPLAFTNGESRSAVLTTWLIVPILPLVGAWIARQRPANSVGWLLLAAGVVQLVGMLHGQVLLRAHGQAWAEPTVEWLVWSSNLLWLSGVAALTFILLLFPDGHAPSQRWRVVGWLAAVGLALALSGLLAPGRMPGADVALDNPIGFDGLAVLTTTGTLGVALLAASLVGAVLSLVARWRRAVGVERLQLRWVAFAAVVALVVMLASSAFPAGSAVEVLGLLLVLGGIPLAIGVAVVRYRLYDLPLVVNRTVVYGLATAVLLAAYTLVTTLTVRVLQWDDATSALAATAVVAMLFSPARDRIQRVVDTRLFGARHDPYAALLELSGQLASEVSTADVPQVLVDRIRAALRVPYAALGTTGAGAVLTHASGELAAGSSTVTVPLRHRGEAIGRVVVGLRPPDADLATPDRRVLEAMAEQAGAALQAARLQEQVQRSTARRVAAVEEERRRIRRDLHDGLGPTLAGIALGLETARRRAARAGDDEAADLLARLHDETLGTVDATRSLAYGLRPPALDELGLDGALRRAFDPHRASTPVTLSVRGLPADPPLPAAVEVAAYRIAVEAVANVVRHAQATSCRVELIRDDALTIVVTDDGNGLPDGWRAGIGITSMRERAAELGGRLTVSARPTEGTRVEATLPIEAAVGGGEVARG